MAKLSPLTLVDCGTKIQSPSAAGVAKWCTPDGSAAFTTRFPEELYPYRAEPPMLSVQIRPPSTIGGPGVNPPAAQWLVNPRGGVPLFTVSACRLLELLQAK